MKGFKGFNQKLQCRGFQFEVGKKYEEEKAECCNTGFHYCQNPLDVFNYYAPADSRYCEVEGSGVVDSEGQNDTKVAASQIHIGVEIGLPGIIKAGVDYIKAKVDWENAKESNTGNKSAATNTGYQSAATNTGYQSAATNTGYQSAATNTGDYSAATNTGDYSAATNTGYQSAATNTGDYSAATNTGDYSAATVEGEDSIACSLGVEGKAKGKKGCWLVLAQWEVSWSSRKLIEVKSVLVDGETIKEDTFYSLIDGQIIEVE